MFYNTAALPLLFCASPVQLPTELLRLHQYLYIENNRYPLFSEMNTFLYTFQFQEDSECLFFPKYQAELHIHLLKRH